MAIRIIGGTLKGRILKAPKGIDITRPILARVRKSFFDIMRPYLDGAGFCDLFAGSGAVGIEAVSRGVLSVVFVDKDREACKCIANNIKYCKIEENCEIHCDDVFKFLEKADSAFDVIFAGPPYPLFYGEKALVSLSGSKVLTQDTKIIVQHSQEEKLSEHINNLICYRREKYGDTILSFFKVIGCFKE
ncbi:MAG: 16S rRNA (guanine(966)-N(2))-methyltransferase RsmD [Elusimicrobiota bacterium]